MAYSVNTYPGDGLYRIRPAADPELCYGIVGQTQANGESVSLVAVSDTDASQTWWLRRSTASGRHDYMLQTQDSQKWMDDTSHHGVSSTDVVVQWAEHVGATATDWQVWMTGGISTVVEMDRGIGVFPAMLLRASTTTPARAADSFAGGSGLANLLVTRAMSSDLTDANLRQLFFFTPCDFFDREMDALEHFDVHTSISLTSDTTYEFDPAIPQYSTTKLAEGIRSLRVDVDGCRCRVRFRFRSSVTGQVTDWIRFLGDSTPTDPAFADPDWGAAWPALADLRTQWGATAWIDDSVLLWSEAPSTDYDIIEMQVSARRYVPAGGDGNADPYPHAGPVVTQSYFIGKPMTIRSRYEWAASVAGMLVDLNTRVGTTDAPTIYPGSFATISMRDADGRVLLDDYVVEISSSQQDVRIPWEAFRDVDPRWLDPTQNIEYEADIILTTPYGSHTWSVRPGDGHAIHAGAIGTGRPVPALDDTSSAVGADADVSITARPLHDLVTVDMSSTSARYRVLSVMADESGRSHVVASHPLNDVGPGANPDPDRYEYAWEQATEWAAPLTPRDLAGISPDVHHVVVLWEVPKTYPLVLGSDPRDELWPWWIQSCGGVSLDAEQESHLASLTYRGRDESLHVVPIEGDLSTTRTITKNLITAQRIGRDFYEAAALAGDTPDLSFTGRLFADQMSQMGDATDDGVVYASDMAAIMAAAQGQTVLIRTAHGTSAWVKISAVDAPRQAARYGDITLALVEVARDAI